MVFAFLINNDSVNIDGFDYGSEKRAENQTPDYVYSSFVEVCIMFAH